MMTQEIHRIAPKQTQFTAKKYVSFLPMQQQRLIFPENEKIKI